MSTHNQLRNTPFAPSIINTLRLALLRAAVAAGLLGVGGLAYGEVTTDPVQFFQGCSITKGTPGQPHYLDQVQGSCFGHRFSNEGKIYPLRCSVKSNEDGRYWGVGHCNYDGKEITLIVFDGLTKREIKAEDFFQGCKVITRVTNQGDIGLRVLGTCLGHTFSNDIRGPVGMSCRVRPRVNEDPGINGTSSNLRVSAWFISTCNIDGKEFNSAWVDMDTKKLTLGFR